MIVPHAVLATTAMIAAIVVTATTGDILTASAMRQVGDLDVIRARRGIVGAAVAVVTNSRFGLGVVCLALSFFSLLFCAFSHRDLSLIRQAATSLTFVTNALAAKWVPARARRPSAVDGGHLRVHRGRAAGVLRFGDPGGATPWDVLDSAGDLPPATPHGLAAHLIGVLRWSARLSGGLTRPSWPPRANPWRFSLIWGVYPLGCAVQSTTSGGVYPLCIVGLVNIVFGGGSFCVLSP